MNRTVPLLVALFFLSLIPSAGYTRSSLQVQDNFKQGFFPISEAVICADPDDYKVVTIAAGMLADDIERVTGRRPILRPSVRLPECTAIVAGTVGHSALIDRLVERNGIDISSIKGKWESYMIVTTEHPGRHTPLLAVIGSDRRGTAFGLTSLSEAIGVSPWYWWADVTPAAKKDLYLAPVSLTRKEPSVQYRGIFINDERFGGWARWAEEHFEKESGKVGPKTYQKVFELLLRLKANYLWPAMHPGTQAFNFDPENARLADDYAIVMGSSHCEQMLRNNEGEWKAVGTYGDFNYITNRGTMQDYWEERVRTNGCFENTYTLGLRGIHDYPMEGASTTAERVRLMQQAIDDQRDMLRRNIDKPLEEIPQVLCTYEEVLDAYHNGLKVPDDVTMLWSDDKHGYCRNLSNPEECRRKGGAGIYYHLSYHGDPASWIWLSPLSPAFISTELTKAYTFGARRIWVFNVGDIKPAEKELSFVMDLAWDIDRWNPSSAQDYIRYWAEKTFCSDIAQEISDIQDVYYRLQAAGKDSHVWFVNYSLEQIEQRLTQWRTLAGKALDLEKRIPERLKNAYFELVNYPVRGAALINEYQLLSRRSMVRATAGDAAGALEDGKRVEELFFELNNWTDQYNNVLLNGKWKDYFNWQPYQWFRSEKIEQPYCTPEILAQAQNGPEPRFLAVEDALSEGGINIESGTDGEISLWIEALSPVRNFSKNAADNVFCRVICGDESFDASATPINNVWHAHWVGPMWSRVGILRLKKGDNSFAIDKLAPGARIDRIFIGLYPPFDPEPRVRIPASKYKDSHDDICCVRQLGYNDGVMVGHFDTPSYENVEDAPFVEYDLELLPDDRFLEVRTLPTLHVYEGRDARYAVRIGNSTPQTFSIHADDFTAEWRLNVLRGYASRTISIPDSCKGNQKLRIYFLDPGIVLQEFCIRDLHHE